MIKRFCDTFWIFGKNNILSFSAKITIFALLKVFGKQIKAINSS